MRAWHLVNSVDQVPRSHLGRNRRVSDYLQASQRDRQTSAAITRFQSIWLYARTYGTLCSRKGGTYGSRRITKNRAWDRA